MRGISTRKDSRGSEGFDASDFNRKVNLGTLDVIMKKILGIVYSIIVLSSCNLIESDIKKVDGAENRYQIEGKLSVQIPENWEIKSSGLTTQIYDDSNNTIGIFSLISKEIEIGIKTEEYFTYANEHGGIKLKNGVNYNAGFNEKGKVVEHSLWLGQYEWRKVKIDFSRFSNPLSISESSCYISMYALINDGRVTEVSSFVSQDSSADVQIENILRTLKIIQDDI